MLEGADLGSFLRSISENKSVTHMVKYFVTHFVTHLVAHLITHLVTHLIRHLVTHYPIFFKISTRRISIPKTDMSKYVSGTSILLKHKILKWPLYGFCFR